MENIYIENGKLISYAGNEAQVIIPEGVTEICSQAFKDNAFVQLISIPDTVTYIGSSAFEKCINLSQINIPLGVTVIPQSMCEGCISLKKIELHEFIEDIRFRAFYGCGLETVTIKAEVRAIDINPFESCEYLKKIDAPVGTVKLLKKYLKGVSFPKNASATPTVAAKKKEPTYVVRYYDDSYKYKYRQLAIAIRPLSVNDFMTNFSMPQTEVVSGSCAMIDITLWGYGLDDINIASIDDISTVDFSSSIKNENFKELDTAEIHIDVA